MFWRSESHERNLQVDRHCRALNMLQEKIIKIIIITLNFTTPIVIIFIVVVVVYVSTRPSNKLVRKCHSY